MSGASAPPSSGRLTGWKFGRKLLYLQCRSWAHSSRSWGTRHTVFSVVVYSNCTVKCQPNFNLRFLTSDHSMAPVRFNWSVFARKMHSTSEFAQMFLSKCECVIGINAKRHNYLQYLLCCKLEVRTPIIPPPNTHCGAICLQLIYSLNMLKRNHRQTACKQMLRFAVPKSGENPWKKSSCDWRLLPSTFAF